MIKLLLILSVLISWSSYGQIDPIAAPALTSNTARITWGFPIKDSKQYELSEFIGVDKSSQSSLWLARENRITMLEKFDTFDNRIISKEINLLQVPGIREPQRVQIESVLLVNNVVSVVTSYTDPKTSRLVLMIHQLSTDGDIITPPSKLVDSATPGSSVLVSLSPDSTRVAIGVSSPSNRVGRKNQFLLRVVDIQMRLLFEKDILLLPESTPDSTKVEVYQMVISREQKVFMLAQQHGKVFDRGPFSLWGIDATTSEVGEVELITDHPMRAAYLRMTSREEIMVCGLYYDNGERQYGGLFYGKVNAQTLSIVRAYVAIPMVTDRPAVNKVQSITFIPRSDGGFVFLAEELWGFPYKIHFGNILVCIVNVDGNGSFCVTIPKAQQHYAAARFSQYSYFPVYNNSTKSLHVIFNENPKNFSPDGKRNVQFPMVLPKHSVPVVVTVGPDGTSTSSQLLEDTFGIVMFPLSSAQVSNHKAFIVGRKKRQFAVGSLIVD